MDLNKSRDSGPNLLCPIVGETPSARESDPRHEHPANAAEVPRRRSSAVDFVR